MASHGIFVAMPEPVQEMHRERRRALKARSWRHYLEVLAEISDHAVARGVIPDDLRKRG